MLTSLGSSVRFMPVVKLLIPAGFTADDVDCSRIAQASTRTICPGQHHIGTLAFRTGQRILTGECLRRNQGPSAYANSVCHVCPLYLMIVSHANYYSEPRANIE